MVSASSGGGEEFKQSSSASVGLLDQPPLEHKSKKLNAQVSHSLGAYNSDSQNSQGSMHSSSYSQAMKDRQQPFHLYNISLAQ